LSELLYFIRVVRAHNSTLPKQDARRPPESDIFLKKNVGLLPDMGILLVSEVQAPFSQSAKWCRHYDRY
jgi:hypothetical protein